MSVNNTKTMPFKNWQNYYIKGDPSYGNLIASILQTVYKNSYISFLQLIRKIETNPAALISGEGAIDLISKNLECMNVMPKLYLTYQNLEINPEEDMKNFNFDNILEIKCDFLMTLDKNAVSDLPDEFLLKIEDTVNIVRSNNKNILLNYLLKQIADGQFFMPLEFISKSIYEEKIKKTKYIIKDLFGKFGITEYANANNLLSLANKNEIINETVNNIKVLNVPFTAYHIDNFLTRSYQNAARNKFSLGKNELHVKLIYLNPEYVLNSCGKSIYDLLAEDTYYRFFYEKTVIEDGKKNELLKNSIIDEIKFLYKEVFANGKLTENKNNGINDIEDAFKNNESLKKQIIKILKSDRTPTRELAVLNNINIERLKIKRNFIEILRNLSNPFLNKVLDTNYIKLLRQYLITCYGENFKDNINTEITEMIEKKLYEYIRSSLSNFADFFNIITAKIAEATGEKEAVVENIIENSVFYKNFVFKKYLKRPKSYISAPFRDITKTLPKDILLFKNDGEECDEVLFPYIKIKEFTVYLISGEINQVWEKLAAVFDEIIPFLTSNIYSINYNKSVISMSLSASEYLISVKESGKTRDFQIKKAEDIDYIFQDYEFDKMKSLIKELLFFHQKTGFGFDGKKEFNEILQGYYKRQSEYFLYKEKSEKLFEYSSHSFFLIAVIKKIFLWLPRVFNDYFLSKVVNKNDSIEKRVTYYYRDANKESGIYNDKEIIDIKEKIAGFIDFNKKVEESILKDTKQKPKETNKKETASMPPIEDEKERKLFEFIKKNLNANKGILFTRNPELHDEQIVLYVKLNRKNALLKNEKPEINTTDEYSTRYYMIKNLIKYKYLVIQEYSINEKDKKGYELYFSPTYIKYGEGIK